MFRGRIDPAWLSLVAATRDKERSLVRTALSRRSTAPMPCSRAQSDHWQNHLMQPRLETGTWALTCSTCNAAPDHLCCMHSMVDTLSARTSMFYAHEALTGFRASCILPPDRLACGIPKESPWGISTPPSATLAPLSHHTVDAVYLVCSSFPSASESGALHTCVIDGWAMRAFSFLFPSSFCSLERIFGCLGHIPGSIRLFGPVGWVAPRAGVSVVGEFCFSSKFLLCLEVW
jgi:hypothetical protein